MKNPRLFIKEDLLDDTVLRRMGKISSQGEKLPLQEIEYKADEKVKKLRELSEEDLAKAIHTLLKKEDKES